MQDRHQFFAVIYYFIWAALLAVFVGIGGREVWIGSHENLIPGGPFSSSDASLKALLEIPHGSTQCADVMRQLSPNPAILFSPRREPKGSLVYGLLSYLSPPRQMQMIEVDRDELEQQIATVDRTSASALIFFRLQPPPDFKGWRIGPNLFIAPLDGSR